MRIALRCTLLLFLISILINTASAQSAPPAPAPRYMVLIDAAHGGDDPGARINSNTVEKNITLAVSVRLRSLLAARGIEVTTTREADKTLDANQRAEIANHASASACIVLHATTSGTGIHLFISSLAPAQAQKLASWKAAQAPFVQQSTALAGTLNSTFQQAGVPVTLARTSLPGLDSMTCPAIAVELATPAVEEGKQPQALTDPAYQSRIADLLTSALIEWRAEAHRP